MNKLVYASIVAVLVSYIGIAIKRIYIKRLRYLSDMHYFLENCIENIESTRVPISIIIDKIREDVGKDFSRTLNNFEEIIDKDRDLIISNVYLNNRDREIIQNCFNRIGKNTQNIELDNLKTCKISIEKAIECAKDDIKKKGDLYAKLGFMLGIALLIILM